MSIFAYTLMMLPVNNVTFDTAVSKQFVHMNLPIINSGSLKTLTSSGFALGVTRIISSSLIVIFSPVSLTKASKVTSCCDGTSIGIRTVLPFKITRRLNGDGRLVIK